MNWMMRDARSCFTTLVCAGVMCGCQKQQPKAQTDVVSETNAEYLSVDLSGGTIASSYPVTYYRTSGDVPGGPNSEVYKTTRLLMRMIPKGTFIMGSPANEFERDSVETQHEVTLTKDFFMGVFEVTQRQWELVMGNRPSYFTNATHYATRPVELVSYYDVRENPEVYGSAIKPNWPESNAVGSTSFMGKLRAKTGRTFDLPTEVQWEYACRAGTAMELNSGKPLTNALKDASMAEVGRYAYNRSRVVDHEQSADRTWGTAEVGSYLPNAWGLYDMHGNVWEWCLDWYPKSEGYRRVLRGGSWFWRASFCRAAYRYERGPNHRNPDYGFRLVLPLGQQ